MYVMLLPSANDAANVLAEHVAGSISDFAVLMNEKAEEIGCTNSHFTNPSGVHDVNLYSTAFDLSLIARYAMNFDTFRKIITTTSYTLPATNKYPKSDRTLEISNALVRPDSKNYYYEYATGIKTGFTNPAKDCLVASAKKDNVEFIIVVLGTDSLENGLRKKFIDCKTLFDFAFDNYTSHYLELQQENEKEVKVTYYDYVTEATSPSSFSNFKVLFLVIDYFRTLFCKCVNFLFAPLIDFLASLV